MKVLSGYITYDPITEEEKAIRLLKSKKAKQAKAQKELEAAQLAAQQEPPKVQEATKKVRKSKTATASGTKKAVEQASVPDEVVEKTVAKKKSTRTRAKKAVPAAEEA